MPASSRSRVAKRKSGVSGAQDEQYNPSARQRFSARPKSVGHQQAGAHSGRANAGASSSVPASPDTVQREALMTEVEKREDRARRNRASALKSRNKRRQRLAFLEAEYAKLRVVVEKLAGEKARLQVENAALKRAAAAVGDGAAGDDAAAAAAHCSGVAVLTPRATCLTPPPSPGPPRRRHAHTAADAGAQAAATTTAPASAPAPDARACSRTPPPPPFAAPPRVSNGDTTAPHTTAAGAGRVVKPAPLRRLPQPLALARLSRVCTFEDFLTAFGDATVSSRGTGDSDTTSCNSSGGTAATTPAMTTADPASACALAPNSSASASTANNDNDNTCNSSSTGDEDPFNSFLRCFDANSGGGSSGLDPSSGGASLLWQLDAADNTGATRDNGDFTGGLALPPAPPQRPRRQQQQNSLLPVAGFPPVMQCRSPRLFAQSSSRPSAASSGGGSHRSGLGRMISA